MDVVRTASATAAPAATSTSPSPLAASSPDTTRTILDVNSVDFHYGRSKALHGINLKIPEKKVTAFIGPSGCGKSTLLRCFNRMNDLIDNARVSSGEIRSIRNLFLIRLDDSGL